MKIRVSAVAALLSIVCTGYVEAAGPEKASAGTSIAPSREAPGTGGTIVKFKNGSVMPCAIVRETPDGVTVDSLGVQFEISREEIEYYGDAANCPPPPAVEVVAEGKQEAVKSGQPAVTISPPKAASPAARPTVSREERFRAHQRPLTPSEAPAALTLADLEGDLARYQGQKLRLSKVTLGALRHLEGFYGIEVHPLWPPKRSKHGAGSSAALTTHGLTFVLTETQAKELQEHSKQSDHARLEFTIEQRVVGNVRYWVAPISRIEIFQGDGDEIAWTMW